MIWTPRYSGPHRSGICRCGHSWQDHHLGCVLNADYLAQTGERYVPGGCEFHDCNEGEGLGPDGEVHCFAYRDTREGEG